MFRRLRTWLGEDRGNVAVMVALSIMPLSLAALGALDIARATAAKLILQDALDSAALATSKATVNDSAVLQSTGDRIFRQNLVFDGDVTLSTDTFVFGSGGIVVADASAAVRPLIIGFITGGPINVGAHAEVKRAGNQLEIALVLDNTGSMAGTKLSNLKTAAKNFLDSMAQAATQSGDPNSIKVSLVPFSQTVRVGSTYATAAWIDQAGASTVNNQLFYDSALNHVWANRFTLLSKLHTSWGGCVESRPAPYDIQDTPPTDNATVFTPYFAPDEPPATHSDPYSNDYLSDGVNSNSDWRYKQGNTAKYTNNPDFSGGKGPNKGCTSLQNVQRLTTSFSSLKTVINAMTAGGTTNIAMGLVWGWHTLSPNAPFADGVPYLTPKHKKIVILMTDGENTMSDTSTQDITDYSGAGYVWQGRILQANGTPITGGTETQRTAAMDDRLAKLCTNMKAADKDIEIYTMRVEVTNGTSTVLQNCASGADHYFDVQSASDLDSVFQLIAGQIASLHLSK